MLFLITGSSGFVGSELLNILSKQHQCLGVGGSLDFPVTDQKSVEEVINREKPDVIVHLAGINNLSYCEENPREAFRVNALGTRNVAQAAAKTGTRMVYISSDLVFSGNKGKGYYEFDYPDPNSVYGWSKWWGEYYIVNILSEYYILRVPLLFGLNKNKDESIVPHALKKAEIGEEIKINYNRVTNPTWTTHLAEVINDLTNTLSFGTYHVGSTGFVSVPYFISLLLEKRGLDPNLVDFGGLEGVKPVDQGGYNVIQSAVLPYMRDVRNLPGWREALETCMGMQ